MAEELEKGAEAPAEPVQTPLSDIIDKPKFSEAPRIADPAPEPKASPDRKPKPEKPEIPPGYVPLRETLDERERRQAAERERDQYRRAFEDYQRKIAAEQDNDPAPDMFRDPNAYNQWLDRQLNKRAEAIARQHVQPIMAQVSDTTLRLSELQAEKHLGPDRFKKLNEWIVSQGVEFAEWARTQPDPYWAAYEQYRQRTTFERLGNDDLDTYEARLKEQIRQQVLAEMRGPVDAPDVDADDDPPPQKPAAPRSFAASRSAAPDRDAGGRFTGPKPLGEILKEKPTRNSKR